MNHDRPRKNAGRSAQSVYDATALRGSERHGPPKNGDIAAELAGRSLAETDESTPLRSTHGPDHTGGRWQTGYCSVGTRRVEGQAKPLTHTTMDSPRKQRQYSRRAASRLSMTSTRVSEPFTPSPHPPLLPDSIDLSKFARFSVSVHNL